MSEGEGGQSSLSDLPLERPVGTVMLLLSLVVMGGVALAQLPLGFVPTLDEPEVDIDAPWQGSHPLEGLREVGKPIEEEVAQIPGVKEIVTTSTAGSVTVEVGFDWSADVDLKKLEVRDAVARARDGLPEGMGHIRVEGDTGDFGGATILQGRLSAERDLSRSWDLLEHHLRRPLERTRGVARVHLYGVEPARVRVDLDLSALKRHGVPARDVLLAIDAGNVDLDLGAVKDERLRHDVRLSARFREVDEVRDLPIGPAGRGLRVRDVARVELLEPRLDYGRHLDRRYAVGIDVFKEPSANTVETVERLLAKIDEVQRDPELAGIKLLVWQNAGEEIERSILGLRDSGLYGSILAVVVLWLFLRRAAATAIVAAAIPASLLITCGGMLALGMELNVITMLGLMLGVGMLVDNAVVVMESIHRLQDEGVPARQAARRGTREVFLAVVASTATTVIVWAWVLIAEHGPLIHYLSGVAVTISLSVVASLLVSLTFIPLCAVHVGSATPERPGFLARVVLPGYRALLAWTLRRRAVSLAALLLLAGSAALPISEIEKSGEPRMRQRAAAITYAIHEPAPRETLEGYVDVVEAWLEGRKAELGYESIYSWYSEGGRDGGVFTWIYLPQERASAQALQRLRERLRDGLPRIAGVKLEVGERMWGGGRGRGQGRTVHVALHGEDPEYLLELGNRAEELLRPLPSVLEVAGPGKGGRQEVTVQVDPERCRAVGVAPEDVGQVVRFAFRGQPLRRFRGPRGEIEMVTGLPDEKQLGLAELSSLPIPRIDATRTVPLSAVAELAFGRTPERIRRHDRETTVWVQVEVDPTLTTEEAQALVTSGLTSLHLPEGYRWDWGSWGRDRDETLDQMARGVALSLVIVCLLMAALFESFTQPLAIFVTLPLAFSGAFWSLWLFGYELDAVAFIGVIILVGIVVNNGIVMVDRVNALRAEGTPRVEAILAGCATRLRPVLMTAITTLVGLVPLVFSASTVAGAYIDSLAVAVIGGLTTSTVFTLLGLPVWYSVVEDVGAIVVRALPRLAPGVSARFPRARVMVSEERS